MITIIGSGKVGGDAALFSALKRLDDQILLLDVVEGLTTRRSNGYQSHVIRARN